MELKRDFTDLLLEWYKENGRNYVWRRNSNPYKILIAEIMLQRTKADQVEPVYLSFIEKFPTVEELDKASEREIEYFFKRLGLFWRAKLVKKLVHNLLERFNGKIPADRKSLLSLPAVGEYMADAVLSFGYGRDVAVV